MLGNVAWQPDDSVHHQSERRRPAYAGEVALARLPYMKTDCGGTFEVANNSLARAVVRLGRQGGPVETLETSTGAVLEMVGR